MIEYRVYGDHAAVKKYTGDEKLIVVPNLFAGKPITEILPYAFAGNKSVEAVVLPDILQEIHPHAFLNCENLETLTSFAAYTHSCGAASYKCGLPALTRVVAMNAFDGCGCLRSVA